MNAFRFAAAILLSFIILIPSAHAKDECLLGLSNIEDRKIELAGAVGHLAAGEADKILEKNHAPRTSKKGYAILVGTMIGSAILTTTVSSHLPPSFQFISVFISQLSTLGVYVLGAPIWEPMTSKFRKWAFGLNQDGRLNAASSPQLEETWTRTQENYSLNAQMSRNIIGQFVFSVKENFYRAYRAHVNQEPIYAADQLAEAAYRMRILFKEVSPEDPSVAAAVATSFTNHVVIDEDFHRLVSQRLENLDADYFDQEVQKYYRSILRSWIALP